MFARLRAYYRTWRLRRLQEDVFLGITPLNTDAEWEAASPDTLAFHHLIKAPLRFAVKAIRVPQHWLDRLEGNPRILWEIIDRVYLKNEKQAWRRALLEPIFKFGVCLIGFDNNYGEVADTLIAAVIQERDLFELDPVRINPDNWYQDGRGRIELGSSAPWKILSVTAEEVVTDRAIASPLITTYEQATDRRRYLALDLAGQAEPWPGVFVYPILKTGDEVLEVAPALVGGAVAG